MISTTRLLALGALAVATNAASALAAGKVTAWDVVCDLKDKFPTEAYDCDYSCSCQEGDSTLFCKQFYDQCHKAACSCKAVVVPSYNVVCSKPGNDMNTCVTNCECGRDGKNYCYTVSDDESCARASCSCK